jgi:hypothetical protein
LSGHAPAEVPVQQSMVVVRHRARSWRLLAVAIAAATIGTGCRVDVTVDVSMEQDGSGTLDVVLVADAEVVSQAGGLEDDLRFDDLVDAGWEVVDPLPTEDGGLQLTLTHAFAAPEELTALLASLNGTDGPFKTVSFRRTASTSDIAFTITGTGRVDAGLASFADADLVAAVGATPYAEDVAIAGLSQSEAVVLTLRVDLPGDTERTTGTETDGTISWVIPLDSRPIDLATATSLGLDGGGGWSIAASVLQVLFVGWLVVAGVVLAYVGLARRRRGSSSVAGRRAAVAQRARGSMREPASRSRGAGMSSRPSAARARPGVREWDELDEDGGWDDGSRDDWDDDDPPDATFAAGPGSEPGGPGPRRPPFPIPNS